MRVMKAVQGTGVEEGGKEAEGRVVGQGGGGCGRVVLRLAGREGTPRSDS